MIVRRKGGLTEFIPSPQEKREGLIRDHVLGLLENIHRRIERLECEVGLPATEAEAFKELFIRIKVNESRNLELLTNLTNSGLGIPDSPALKIMS
jgi:hypothetical protein